MTRIGLVAALAMLAPAAIAQQLDPRLAGPLQAMYQQAAAACQAGAPAGCQQMQNLQQVAGQLTQAQAACQQGNMQACQFYNNGAQQVMMAWQQAQAPQQPMPSQGYSPQQQQWDHQQRMMQQQQQFQQHQWQMQQQQRLNDQQHQRFMEQLRR